MLGLCQYGHPHSKRDYTKFTNATAVSQSILLISTNVIEY